MAGNPAAGVAGELRSPVQHPADGAAAQRVLFVINSLATGGAETLLCEFARELASRERTTVALATLYPALDEGWRLEGSGVEVASLGMRSRLDVLHGSRRLGALIRSFRPDVVHAHLFPTSLVTALALSYNRGRGVGAVFTEHGEDNNRRGRRWFRPVDAWSYRAFHRVLCVSASTRARLLEWIPEAAGRAMTLPNAVALPGVLWNPDGPWAQDLLYVGRLEPVKGLDVLLHALRHLRDQGETLSLAVVGHGSMREPWERLALELGLGGQVSFVGKSGDVGRHMRASRVLVLPSRNEGMPMVMLEGMALGMPVVATAVGGSPELLGVPAEAGALAPPEDPHALAAEIRAMLADRGRQIRCGREARRRVEERYSLGSYTDTVVKIYADVAARASGVQGAAPA